MAATQLVAEIYKFRMMTLEYDMSRPRVAEGAAPFRPPSEREQQRLARNAFVARVKAFHGACVNELSRGVALTRKRPKVSLKEQQEHRLNEEKPRTLAQWLELKQQVERHYYNTSWAFPTTNFLSWIAGLQPYLDQPALRTELRSVLDSLTASKKVVLINGRALGNKQSKTVREALAVHLGLKKSMLEPQRRSSV